MNGYHAVQFGQDGTAALDKQTVLDGVYLEDGLATASSGSGSFNTRGGGAVVPKGAHMTQLCGSQQRSHRRRRIVRVARRYGVRLRRNAEQSR